MKNICVGLVAVGFVLLVAGFVWPRIDDGSSTWSAEKSLAYREASSRSHAATTALSSQPPTAENLRLAAEANAEFQTLKAELDAARERGIRTAFWMKLAGGLLAGVGGVAFLILREPA